MANRRIRSWWSKFLTERDLEEIAHGRGFVMPGTPNFRRAALRRGYVKPGTRGFRSAATERGYIRLTPKKFAEIARERGYERQLRPDEVVSAQRFSVEEVIDVGVMTGTRWLYDSFPDASFVLVDPLPDGEALLKWRPADYTFVNCGLGAEPGTLTLQLYKNKMLTSFLDLHHYVSDDQIMERRRQTATVDVAVRTLDEIIEGHCHSDNIGVKLDTEGFELEVIKGLDKHKSRVNFIVAEVSVIRRHKDSYQFSDLVAALRDRGFYFLNVMNPLAPSRGFLDVIFVQRQDPRLETPVWRMRDLEARDRAARASTSRADVTADEIR